MLARALYKAILLNITIIQIYYINISLNIHTFRLFRNFTNTITRYIESRYSMNEIPKWVKYEAPNLIMKWRISKYFPQKISKHSGRSLRVLLPLSCFITLNKNFQRESARVTSCAIFYFNTAVMIDSSVRCVFS